MRKLVLAGLPVATLFLLVAAAPAPSNVPDLAMGQVRSSDGKIHLGSKSTPVSIDGPLTVSAVSAGLNDGGAAITLTCRGLYNGYDMPSLKGPNVTMNSTTADTPWIACAGAGFGDTCLPGLDQIPVNSNTIEDCRVVDGGAVVARLTCTSTDGGTCDQPDASYFCRCFR